MSTQNLNLSFLTTENQQYKKSIQDIWDEDQEKFFKLQMIYKMTTNLPINVDIVIEVVWECIEVKCFPQ